MKFTTDEKNELLINNGWEIIIGYGMKYETPEESNTCIISVEEIRSCIGKQPETYYFPIGNYEYARDIDDAWECFVDDVWMKEDLKNEQDVEIFLANKLIELSQSSKDVKE